MRIEETSPFLETFFKGIFGLLWEEYSEMASIVVYYDIIHVTSDSVSLVVAEWAGSAPTFVFWGVGVYLGTACPIRSLTDLALLDLEKFHDIDYLWINVLPLPYVSFITCLKNIDQ